MSHYTVWQVYCIVLFPYSVVGSIQEPCNVSYHAYETLV